MNPLSMISDNNLNLLRGAELRAQQEARTAEQKKTVSNFSEIDEAAKEFEAVFLTEMLKPMFEGLEPDPSFGGGKGEEIFQSFMLEEYGKTMAEAGGIGIADYVRDELLRIQEASQQKSIRQEITQQEVYDNEYGQ